MIVLNSALGFRGWQNITKVVTFITKPVKVLVVITKVVVTLRDGVASSQKQIFRF